MVALATKTSGHREQNWFSSSAHFLLILMMMLFLPTNLSYLSRLSKGLVVPHPSPTSVHSETFVLIANLSRSIHSSWWMRNARIPGLKSNLVFIHEYSCFIVFSLALTEALYAIVGYYIYALEVLANLLACTAWVFYVNALLPQFIHIALAVLKLCHLENTHVSKNGYQISYRSD